MSANGALLFDSGTLMDEAGRAVDWPALAVIGDPIEHSRSPALHRAALAAHGLVDRYEMIRVGPAQLVDFLERSLQAGMRGVNLTLPHKEAVLRAGCRAAEEVRRIGAANTLVRRADEWVAHNTDARGFALALSRWRGRALPTILREVLLIGSGGAARAVHAALVDLGARRLRIAVRELSSAQWASESGIQPESLTALQIGAASLVVQCTPLGWKPEDPSPVPAEQWSADVAAFDLGYAAGGSRFLCDAAAAGAVHCDGLRMLVAQAALAFTMWYGGESPLATMADAAGFDW